MFFIYAYSINRHYYIFSGFTTPFDETILRKQMWILILNKLDFVTKPKHSAGINSLIKDKTL